MRLLTSVSSLQITIIVLASPNWMIGDKMAISMLKNKERKTLMSWKASFLRKLSYLEFPETILQKTARIRKDFISIDMAPGKLLTNMKIVLIIMSHLLNVKFKMQLCRNNHYRLVKNN